MEYDNQANDGYLTKEEISFTNNGLRIFSQDFIQQELLKIFRKFLEKSSLFLGVKSQQEVKKKNVQPAGLKVKKDQALILV